MHEELSRCAVIRVQSWSIPNEPPTVRELNGMVWPMQTGTLSRGQVEVLCLGPTEWLVLASDPAAGPTLTRQLASSFEGSSYRATDMSSGLARFRVVGPDARATLAKGSGLDLHPDSFAPDQCARTRFAEMPLIIRCLDQGRAFECIVPASLASYLSRWLSGA
jgi:heterotetrameric sarcosine oxidase gamma subunit